MSTLRSPLFMASATSSPDLSLKLIVSSGPSSQSPGKESLGKPQGQNRLAIYSFQRKPFLSGHFGFSLVMGMRVKMQKSIFPHQFLNVSPILISILLAIYLSVINYSHWQDNLTITTLKVKKTSQELQMLSNVTLNCQKRNTVMNSGSQLSEQ